MGRKVELVRRHPGVLIVGAAICLAVVSGFYRSAPDGSAGASDASDRTEAGPGANADGDHRVDARSGAGDEGLHTGGAGDDGGADGRGGADEASNDTAADDTASGDKPTPTSTLVPPDVARPRPSVNLDQPPGRSDVAEVARWCAAVYAAYAGAEPGEELGDRLGELATAELRAELTDLPPPASYGPPVDIDGASAGGPFVREDQDETIERTVRVSVETPDALVIYDVALVDTSGSWQVKQLEAL